MPTTPRRTSEQSRERGFTLVELLVTMSITMVILGATMASMNDAIKATDSAIQLTNLNNGLRTSMDLMVRDLLQVGQGLPTGNVILVPSGGAQPLLMPGPPGTAYQLAGATEISAVMPGPGLGPSVDGQQTDMITTIAADSAFEHVKLTALAANGSSMAVWNGPSIQKGANITDGGPDDLDAGDLIMLTRQSISALVQITSVVGQTVSFAPADSLNLNQTAAANGTVSDVFSTPANDGLPNPQTVPPTPTIETEATRIRMITYYLDVITDPQRPRLVRRINNGHPTTFDNTLGTAVAFDIENLQITYDLADGTTNPANVRMEAADLDGTGACAPDPCSPNQIRKVNIMLAGRSRAPMKDSRQFLRNRLITQVSLRSLAFVDRYQ